jgi:hypothetical protein
MHHLRAPRRALRACDALGVASVADFLARSRDDFLGVPNCGARTYAELDGRVRRFLADDRALARCAGAGELDAELDGVIPDERARRALARIGIETVGQLLAAPDDEVLALPGIDQRAYAELVTRARREDNAAPTELLPPTLLQFSLAHCYLPDRVRADLASLSIATVSDLLRCGGQAVAALGRVGVDILRTELERLVRLGDERFRDPLQDHGSGFRAFLDRILAACDSTQRKLLRHRLGIGCRALPRWQLAARLQIDEEQLGADEHALAQHLRGAIGWILDRLRVEVREELRAFEGLVISERLASGTLLHAGSRSTGDPDLPLRLAAFCFPDEFHFHDGFLVELDAAELEGLRERLRRATRSRLLPLPVETLRAQLEEAGLRAPRELVLRILRDDLRRAVRIDPARGEVVTPRAVSIGDRLQHILEEHAEPMPLDDVSFHYRDRHRRSNRNVLRDRLRQDSRFLEVGRDRWSLRDRHLDELEMARIEAERISASIRIAGGRHDIRRLTDGSPCSERVIYLMTDVLRHDPGLRDLGRGQFCPRHQSTSKVMGELIHALRRAAGEIPVSRYLENQAPERRRLVESLLSRNRRFVSPGIDRIDLLDNYPFNGDRLRRLTIVCDQCLAEHRGYATTAQLLHDVRDAGLAGSFLTEHMLADLLRRHGRFEFLAGGLVAQASLGLTGWIRQRARETIRSAGHSLTPNELLSERPELAEFESCLEQVLLEDPLIQCFDGERFQLV